MRYYKTIDTSYIISIGTGSDGTEITEQEYTEILAVIRDKPTTCDGSDYRLKTDLKWEEYEKPEPEPEPEEDASPEDYEQALQQMGVNFNDEN